MTTQAMTHDGANATRERAQPTRDSGQSAREEPALLSNLSEALRRRGVNHWNDAQKAVDAAAKTRGTNLARQDWVEAAEKAQRALVVIREREADPLQQPVGTQPRVTATGARAQAMRLVAQVDQSQAKAAWDAFAEYISVVEDPARKSMLKGEELQMFFDAKAYDIAIARARAVLQYEPAHLDAQRVLGMSLISSGDIAKIEEATTHLQRYLDQAPDTDPLKESARAAFEKVRKQ